MSVKIDLAPEIEASYAKQAAAQGVSLPKYLQHVLEEQVAPAEEKPLTPAERATFWRDSAKGLPYTAPLPDEAISRESIYSARG
jgi:hypothetical protein